MKPLLQNSALEFLQQHERGARRRLRGRARALEQHTSCPSWIHEHPRLALALAGLAGVGAGYWVKGSKRSGRVGSRLKSALGSAGWLSLVRTVRLLLRVGLAVNRNLGREPEQAPQ